MTPFFFEIFLFKLTLLRIVYLHAPPPTVTFLSFFPSFGHFILLSFQTPAPRAGFGPSAIFGPPFFFLTPSRLDLSSPLQPPFFLRSWLFLRWVFCRICVEFLRNFLVLNMHVHFFRLGSPACPRSLNFSIFPTAPFWLWPLSFLIVATF